MKEQIGAVVALTTLWSNQALSRSEAPESDTQISKQIENPVTRRITLPLHYQADFLDGPYKSTKDIFSINQAVVPFVLDEEWILATRTKLPAIVQPPKQLGNSWAPGCPTDTPHSFCRRDMVGVSIGVQGRFSIIRPRRI